MRHKYLILLFIVLVGCTTFPSGLTVTPLPGWREIVSDLLLTDVDIANGWVRTRDWPKGSLTDPTINHVYRSWWRPNLGYGEFEQHIWRSLTIDDAHSFYLEYGAQRNRHEVCGISEIFSFSSIHSISIFQTQHFDKQ